METTRLYARYNTLTDPKGAVRPIPMAIAVKLTKAAELFASRGLDQTTMEEVTDATGVPKATLYYYFTGKEEILAHLLADMLHEMADAVAATLDRPGFGVEQLAAVIEAQLDVMRDHPAACRALIADLGWAGRIPEIATAIGAAFYSPVAEVLAHGVADGSLRATDDPTEAVVAIFGAVTITGLHALVRDESIPETTAGRIVGMLMHGLAAETT